MNGLFRMSLLLVLLQLVVAGNNTTSRRVLQQQSSSGGDLECLVAVEEVVSESEGETEAYEILCLADDYLFYPLPDWVVDQYETELLEDEDGLPLYMLVKGGSLPESVDDPILVPDNAEILFENKPFGRLRGRRLYQSGIKTIGVSSVLMVRILALDAEPMHTAEELGSRLFDDGATLRGTFLNCSFGGLTLNPGVREGSDIVNGIGSVSVSLNAHESTRRQLVSAATVAINAKYGIANFDHIMFCLPFGTRDGSLGQNWVATGIKNAYRTTFNDEWCSYQSALVHELGHNLALDHSGHNGHPYEDQSCLMGYTYKANFQMCFNGHKHWVLGWYDSKKATINPVANGPWVGRLVAFVDFEKGIFGENAILNVGNLFIQYNRAKDFNRNVLEFRDQVTIVRGTHPSVTSWLLAALGPGDTYTTDENVVIEACKFSEFGYKDFVEISIYTTGQLSQCSPPTQPPTESPSMFPTRSPTSSPTTSPPSFFPTVTATPTEFGTEEPSFLPSSLPSEPIPTPSPSASPTTSTPSAHPTASPSSSPSTHPTASPTKAPSREPTYDTCDDDASKSFWVDFLGQYQKCIWLEARPNLHSLLCDPNHESDAYNICEETCGKCSDECEDDSNGKFEINGVLRDCLYMSLRPIFVEQECHFGRDAWAICRETCGNCITGPSAAPTAKPTTSMPTTTASPTRITQRFDDCDDDLYHFFEVESGGLRGCLWLANQSETDRSLYCDMNHPSLAHRKCKESCGVCSDSCVDDSTASFATSLGVRDCEWLSQNPLAARTLCDPLEAIWELCPETCGNCPPPPTASPAPSPAPTTRAPITPAPTTSNPTAAPVVPTEPPISGVPPCNVCGLNGARVTNPGGMVSFPGYVDPITCAEFEAIGLEGGIDAEFCPFMFGYTVECDCGFLPTATPVTSLPTLSPEPTIAPTTAAPVSPRETTAPKTPAPSMVTNAPVTYAPNNTPFPHSGYRACNVCGVEGSRITILNAIIDVPDVGMLPCAVVQGLGDEGFLSPEACDEIPPLVWPCQCTGIPTPAPVTPAPVVPTLPPVTPAPQYTPYPFTGYKYCNICGDEDSSVTNSGAILNVPALSEDLNGQTCGFLQIAGRTGFIPDDVCDMMDQYVGPCECTNVPSAAPVTPAPTPAPVTPAPTPSPTTAAPQYSPAPNTGFPPCFVCGDETSHVTNLDAMVFTPNLDPLTCRVVEALGEQSWIDPETCAELPTYTIVTCGCTEPPTEAPITPAPVPATPSPSSVPSIATPSPSSTPSSSPSVATAVPSLSPSVATPAPTPGPSPVPTAGPTPGPSPAPTPPPTQEPSVSPSFHPTPLPTPSPTPGPTEPLPTTNPTDSPTTTPSIGTPFPFSGNRYCNVCGMAGSVVSNPAVMVDNIPEVGIVNCAVLTALGETGFIDDEVCETIPSLIGSCGCTITAAPITPAPSPLPTTAAPQHTPAPHSGFLPCNICGPEGSRVTIENAMVIAPDVDPLSCRAMQALGDLAYFAPDLCAELPTYTVTTCGCAVVTTTNPTPAPTPAPTGDAFGACSICGVDGSRVTNDDALVVIAGQPPALCSAVQQIADANLIPLSLCSAYTSQVVATCGCSDGDQSVAPVDSPRLTIAPTPTPNIRYAVCHVCGSDTVSVSEMDALVETPGRSSAVSCGFLQFIGRRGLINPEDCAAMPQYMDACGCRPKVAP